MLSFSTRIEIQASPGDVWRILTELPKWTEWNTTVERTIGNVALGEKVTVFVKQSPGRAFPLRVTGLEPPRLMVWTGGMPLGLFAVLESTNWPHRLLRKPCSACARNTPALWLA